MDRVGLQAGIGRQAVEEKGINGGVFSKSTGLDFYGAAAAAYPINSIIPVPSAARAGGSTAWASVFKTRKWKKISACHV
jgi:hypothetical protein